MGINYQRIRQLVSPPENPASHKKQSILETGSIGYSRPDSQHMEASGAIQVKAAEARAVALREQEAAIALEQATKAKAKECRSCEGMKDFVVNLQEEIKRLASITSDF